LILKCLDFYSAIYQVKEDAVLREFKKCILPQKYIAIARFEGRQPKNQKKSKGQKVNRSEAQKAWSGDQMVRESGQKVTGSDE